MSSTTPRFSVMLPPGTHEDVHTDDAHYASYVQAHYKKQGVHAVLVDHEEDIEDLLDKIAQDLEERYAH